MAIKTKPIKCKTFKGVDVIRARESAGMYQKDLALKGSLGIGKLRRYEEGRWIVIPRGYKVIEQGNFELLQRALR